jgi:LmbE family N-acetylglucosaminyl deacetylase
MQRTRGLDAGFEPWTVSEVWMMATPTADTFVDTTDQIDRKLDALRFHVSQHQDPDMLDSMIRDWGAMVAEAAGYPAGRLAEGFQRVATT